MNTDILLLAILPYLFINVSDAGICGGNDNFGEGNPDSKHQEIESNTGFGYMMNDVDYIIDCCGVTEKWEARFENVVGSRTVYFQIWRPTTGSTHELVGEHPLTVTSNTEQDTGTLAISDRVTIKTGDKFGWWTSGNDIITYKKGGGEEDDNWFMSLGDIAVGATADWSSATVQKDRSYGIRLDVEPNNAPTFTNLPTTDSVTNDEPIGSSLYTVTFTDIDPDDVSSMTISMASNSKFSFDTSTHILTTATALSGASTTETLTFTVTDQCGNTVSSTYTLTITNTPPTINNLPASSSINEDETAKTLLYTIDATDSVDAVTCSKASSVPASYPFSVLQIGATTDYGIYNDPNPGFDYDVTNQYVLTIDCTDGVNTVSNTFTVNILENAAPVITNLQNSVSISTTDAIGTNVFTVISTDAEGDDLTYAMTCSPTPCPFDIFDSGAIQINQDLTLHTIVGYDLSITVSDARNTVGPSILTVTIADINDPVLISNLPLGAALSVAENTVLGTTQFTVSYTDVDTLQTHTFVMTSSPATGINYFTIDSSTGVVTTAGNILNYEVLVGLGTTTFTFSVTVNDPVTSDTQSLVIGITDVNENPSFGQTGYSLSASEGTAGTVIGTPSFGITDPDSGDTATLSLDCSTYTSYFYMDSTSGEVSYQSNYDLDSGSLPTTVPCTVTVTDSGGLTDTAALTITIANTNDNTPAFSPTAYTFYISYYAVVGTTVGTITATDGDSGAYGVLTFSLDQTALGQEYFSIDIAGVIVATQSTGAALGHSTSVTLNATATDAGGLSATAIVVIVISGTTTVVTTSTTEGYVTFLQDTKNIVWFVASIIALLVVFCALIYVAYTCRGKNGCGQCMRKLRKKKKKAHRSRRHRHRRPSPSPSPSPTLSFVSEIRPDAFHSVRHPPPSRSHQPWRRGKYTVQ